MGEGRVLRPFFKTKKVMAKIIAIHGLMGHGKDTFGRMISERLRAEGYHTVNQRFASAVKQCAEIMTGVKMAESALGSGYTFGCSDFNRVQKSTYLEDWGMTLGEFLQKFATEAVRDNLHQDAWLMSVQASVNGYEDSKTVHIITDLRFENEAEWLTKQHDHHVEMIKIVRPEQESDGRDMSHSSEAGLTDMYFNHIIRNDSTLEALGDVAITIVDDIVDEYRTLFDED